MDLLDENPNDKKDYKFASTGINDYLGELNTPKQAQEIDENDGFEELENLQPIDDEPLEKLKANNSVAHATASIVTITLDTTLSTALGLYAGDKAENYKADPDQREELQDAIAEYVKLKGGDIPPGFALFLIILAIYGGKGAEAFQFRKQRKESEAKDLQIKELEAKLEKFKLKNAEFKKSAEDIEPETE
jgi:hypothetical protein